MHSNSHLRRFRTRKRNRRMFIECIEDRRMLAGSSLDSAGNVLWTQQFLQLAQSFRVLALRCGRDGWGLC